MGAESKADKNMGASGIKETLLSGKCGTLLIDIDDTVWESKRLLWSDGVSRKILPETFASLKAVKEAGIKIGIATEQSVTGIHNFLGDINTLWDKSDPKRPFSFFEGLVVCEGGGVAVNLPNKEDTVLLAPRKSLEERQILLDWLNDNFIKQEGDWGTLNGSDLEMCTPVAFPPHQCISSITLWEKGPHISSNPEFIERYAENERVVREAITRLGLTTLTTYEAGNGTLRIVPNFFDKAHTLGHLASAGFIDLKHTVYACDGTNDLELAQKIKNSGGKVIAVANAIKELHQIADFSASLPAGRGVAQVVSLILPEEYQKAIDEIASKGLSVIE